MPTDPGPLVSSHGQTLTFNGITGLIRKVHDVDVSFTDALEDVSDLSLAEGSLRVMEPKPLKGSEELKIDADFPSGGTLPKINDEGALACSVGNVSGWAVCTNATVKYAAGELITLSLAFKIGDTPD